MTATLEYLQEIRRDVSSESFKTRDVERDIRNLLENPSDHNFDKINALRRELVLLIGMQEAFCEKLQALTWKVINPTKDDLLQINEIIVLGRSIDPFAARLVDQYRPLWEKEVLFNEIDQFRDLNEYCQETLDDIESVFFILPSVSGFKESTNELESL